MSKRSAARIGWSLWTLAVLMSFVVLVIEFLNDRTLFISSVFGQFVSLAFVSVGALIVSRHHQNLVGWIFLVGALIMETAELALDYAVYGLVTAPGSLPGGAWAAFFGDWARSFGFTFLVLYLFLFFPDGRTPSARWRFAAWVPVASLVVLAISESVIPYPNDFRLQFVPNPLGLGVRQDLSNLLSGLPILSTVASVVIGAAALISRFRRSRGDERQQLKWFAYAVVIGTCLILGLMVNVILGLNDSYALSTFLFTAALALIPLATGIAILRYRLYGIDIIIRRTLIYGVLTALLVLVYFGSIVVLQQIFRSVTGQSSDLAIIISTLAIAALFNPLRERVQSAIDHRFYRRKYDAEQVLAAFSAAARDEVELEKLAARLLDVVDQTMQPAGVSLWLKKADDRRQRME